MNKPLRVLLIAYYYPPLGGPASIRLGKTVKYLKQEGIKVDVVSVKNVAYHSTDQQMLEESLPNRIEYASSYELSTWLYYFKKIAKLLTGKNKAQNKQIEGGGVYFLLPEKIRGFLRNILPIDDKLFWYFGAKKKGLKLLRTRKHDFIIASIGPYTAALVGYSLSKMTGIPLLVDYRDHWTLNPYEQFWTPFHKSLAEIWERKVIAQAKYMTFIGKTMRDELKGKYPDKFPEKTAIIYNGYDESDFAYLSETAAQENPNFTFTYAGNFYHQRSPYYFCKAVESLIKDNKLPENVRINFIGNYHREARTIMNNPLLKDIVRILPYQPHRETIKLLMKSDCLLLFIPSADGKSVITSKVFEYLRCGKPILAMISEESEAADIIKWGYKEGSEEDTSRQEHYICHPENIEEIAQTILAVLEHEKTSLPLSEEEIKRRYGIYSREEQTKKLINLMRGQDE